MKQIGSILLVLSLLIACIYLLLAGAGEQSDDDNVSLVIYCAAGLQQPVEEIAQLYEKETGTQVQLNFGGSGQLYSQLELVGGDLYFPADMSYLEQAKEAGLLDDIRPVSILTAGLIVAKGNPKNIDSLEDLTRDDVSVVIAERTAAVGIFTHNVLEQEGLLEKLEAGQISKSATVNEVALQVELGSADVGIVWDVLLPQFKACEFVSVEEFTQRPKYAGVGLLHKSSHRSVALEFMEYLTSDEAGSGAEIFQKYGFDVIEGREN